VLNAINTLNIKEDFLVANADTWLEGSIRSVSNVAPCSIGVVHVNDTSRYGALKLNSDTILEFNEKSENIGPGFINSGVYHLSPNIFSKYKVGEYFSLENSIFPSLVSKKMLKAVVLDSKFIDIGVPEDYYKVCRWIESGKKYGF
jgi:D-glycero-alpha-D-manno-heptose 1-phosphate guanylyltransferase